jgi:hypothetical protein
VTITVEASIRRLRKNSISSVLSLLAERITSQHVDAVCHCHTVTSRAVFQNKYTAHNKPYSVLGDGFRIAGGGSNEPACGGCLLLPTGWYNWS